MAEPVARRPFKPTLAAAAALLVVVTAVAAALVLFLFQQRDLRRAALDRLEARAVRLAERSQGFLERAQTLAIEAAAAVDGRILATDFGAGDRDTGAYLLLKAQLRSLYRLMGDNVCVIRAALADVRGDFWGVEGLADGRMLVKSVVRVADPHRCPEANAARGGDRDGTCVVAARLKGDAGGNVTSSEPLPDETYDPRTESWYQEAAGAKAPVLGLPAAEAATGRAAAVLSTPVIDAAGRVLGVLALTLDLGEFSRFASDLGLPGQARAMLALADGRLAAWSGEGGPVLAARSGNATALADPAAAGSPGAARALALLAGGGSPGAGQTVRLDFALGGADWLAAARSLPEQPGRPALKAVVAAPARELLPGWELADQPGLYLALALAVAGSAAALFLGRMASRQVSVLAGDLHTLRDLDLESVPDRSFALRELDGLAGDLALARDRLAVFRSFLPMGLVRRLVRSGDVESKTVQAEITLLHAWCGAAPDSAPDAAPPAEVLESVDEAVRGAMGMAYRAGQSFLAALWNAPREAPDHPHLACQAALAVLRSREAAAGEGAVQATHPLHLGIHSGPAGVGLGGSRSLVSFGVDSQFAAVAEHMARLARAYGVGCVLSRQARDLVKDRTVTRVLDVARLPGAEKPALVYELVAARGQAPERTREFIRLYESGLGRLLKGEPKEASRLLLAAHKLRPRPGDASCSVLLKRCIAGG